MVRAPSQPRYGVVSRCSGFRLGRPLRIANSKGRVQSNGDLRFDFSDSASLVIDGEPGLDTTVESWWIAAR